MKQSPIALRNDWFTKLTGFSERSPNEVRENITIRDGRLTSKINDQSFQFGCLEIVSLRELRERVAKFENGAGKLQVAELVGDAKALHADPANAGAVRSDVRPNAQWTGACLRWMVDQKLVSR